MSLSRSHRNDDYVEQKMIAPREETSVTLFLYAFKRWFTFMGCSSALPTILTTAQRYEHFLKYTIGKSLFVLQRADLHCEIVIHPAGLKYRTNHPQGARAPKSNTGRCVAFAAQRPKFFELHIIPELY